MKADVKQYAYDLIILFAGCVAVYLRMGTEFVPPLIIGGIIMMMVNRLRMVQFRK
jgi:hypothetical protein